MDISYIKKIIKLVEHSGIDELELEEEGKKIKVARKRKPEVSEQTTGAITLPSMHVVPTQIPQYIEPAKSPVQIPQKESQYHEIRSPIVGTFYRAPAPDAEPYVEVGQTIRAGLVLCIVEAMKLMNEIESDCDGTVVKIMAENGKPVEYNQILFLVEKM
jgi:acetyl-CoA carboxylase biotin carboxyl carrier protein